MAENRLIHVFLGIIAIVIIFIIVIGIQMTLNRVARAAITLPSNAVKLTECVPNMGEHWANPANLPVGPIYLVDKRKVVGVEYSINEDELEKNILLIGEEKVGKPLIMPTRGIKFDHIELNYMPEGHAEEGHEGDIEPTYDIHMYLIPQEEQQKLCQ